MSAANKKNLDLYRKWRAIKTRCYNPNAVNYKNYGGRGITFYWKDDYEGFSAYVSTLGWKPGLTIERIDNNGNYEPGNVKWATMKEQGRNKRNNHVVMYNGKQMALSEACEIAGVSVQLVKDRVNNLGWDFDKAISLPAWGINEDTNPTMRLVDYKGERLTIRAACRKANVSYARTLHRMDKLHWSFEQAIDTPSLRQRKMNVLSDFTGDAPVKIQRREPLQQTQGFLSV